MRLSTSQLALQGVNNILSQQSSLSKTQAQLASGKEILNPSDDPAGASRILELDKAINTVERYNRNADQAETRLGLSENVLSEFGNTLQRVRELSVQAANGSQDRETRAYIASELREAQDQLVQLANTDDGNGEYLFAGSETRTQPFTKTAGGKVEYNGDQGQREVRIGPSRTIAVDNSGFDAFMKIPNGNGQYQVSEDSENAGSGIITVGDTPARLNPDERFVVEFSEDGGELTYTVYAGDPSEENPVDGLEQEPYEPGMTISIPTGNDNAQELQVKMDGNPADRDSFNVEAAQPQSIFKSVDDLIKTLENDGDGPAMNNAINRFLADIDQGMENVVRVRSELGARMNALDSSRDANEGALLDLKSAKSKLEDLDYAEASGRFNQELVGLQAAQQTYTRLQGLSLFDFI
ncbi:flagellar hook-associated protein 3 FlgL [Alkalispirillum mobile]|uniref:Flagellar hook-associated protein 3 FlgL n=1 Tax=Alkalispirillum mobile TaxID=85925 RepID=A0A498C057_9GAMM|nr:flagellar hook-associated protein FlgL [Alkalispirillum mobile]RLK48673.1 flagellar hook-associated protein 3 FlgL [Alkalispirillum mobile]